MEWNDLLHILLIVCPLVFLGGIVDAVAGGGGLITLPRSEEYTVFIQ